MAEDRMLSDEILLGLIKANSGGGGGGTSNYNDLSNKPQIGGVTLSGNKSASDLGLVAAEAGKVLSSNDYTNEDKAIVGGVTAALAGKQGVLTAGNYVSIADDGTIKVTQSIGVYDVYSYELMSTGVGITIQLTKKINNVTISTQEIRNEDYSPTNKLTVDGLFELWYDMSNFYWHYKLLVDSEEHQKNEDINWYYRTMADYTETFDVSQDSSTDLATKGDVDTALALKQDKTDNSLQTTDKTVVGAINEHEGDISSLKSGLTDLSDHVDGDAVTYPYADVITINDAVPANLADCKVKIEPAQDLHGYDKPWVGGAGKNKLWCTREAGTRSHLGGTIITNADGTIELDGTFSENFTLIYNDSLTLPSGSYKLNGGITDCSMTITNVGSTYNTNEYAFTLDSDYSGSLTVYITAIQYNHTIIKPMIRLATETDATFVPYTNICPISGHTEASVTVADDADSPTVTKTYTLALGDTIYGGTVDFDSGVMTVDRGNIASYAGETLPGAWISSMDVYTEGGTPTTGAQVVYELATPTTIQLTPQQIQLLKGTNTITASTGQISVTTNGVNGAIGAVQEQVNEIAADIAEKLPTAPTTDGTYTLTVTVADGTPTYSWVSGS